MVNKQKKYILTLKYKILITEFNLFNLYIQFLEQPWQRKMDMRFGT